MRHFVNLSYTYFRAKCLAPIGVGDGGGQGARVPLKFGKKIGQFLCKIRAFIGQESCKFGHFVNFSYIFFGQKCRASLKLTELLQTYTDVKLIPYKPVQQRNSKHTTKRIKQKPFNNHAITTIWKI